MEMTIEIERLRTYSYHGVMEQEQLVGNFFETTVRLTYPTDIDSISDDLANTINYAVIAGIIETEMAIPSKLLEYAAARIQKSLMAHFPSVTSGSVTVAKTTPPLGKLLASASVTLSW